ncbi:hypothetical protein F0562_028143 [Nyssa sinensis]|uniref:Peptidase A1 domain-containing protein n=1 Tax=Nyssa sinensis TaxID=561372 RepID=A0A5J5B830_9ASTE|nr:hypothetical protein F0562_028143 [Nyssa sinensis]
MAALMASLPFSILSLLFLLLTTETLLPLASSTSRRALHNHHIPNGFRVSLKHVHSGQNFTKLELIQQSINRSKNRTQRFETIATAKPTGDDIQTPVYAGDGEFLMNISIGTPAIPFSAIMDTGSDLIWTQCSPCTSNGCKYMYMYGDESSTQGFMAMETFTFLDSVQQEVAIPNIGFGCGLNNQGSGLGQGSGLVGLGRGELSLVSQLGVPKFSYCLTSIGENKTSTLLLGSLADLNYSGGGIHGTPIIQNPFQPSFYYISLEGITVGETLLPISKSLFRLREDGSGGMIIDSGTTITYIQEDAFDVLKKEFMSQMKLRVSRSADATGLDLCFDLPTKDVTDIAVPKLKFHFKGVDLELPVENYMIADENMKLVCLAMAATGAMSIFGNIQQQNLLVLHDLGKETLSFVPTQCDQL